MDSTGDRFGTVHPEATACPAKKPAVAAKSPISTTTKTVDRLNNTPAAMPEIAISSTGRRPNRAASTPAWAEYQVPARYATIGDVRPGNDADGQPDGGCRDDQGRVGGPDVEVSLGDSDSDRWHAADHCPLEEPSRQHEREAVGERQGTEDRSGFAASKRAPTGTVTALVPILPACPDPDLVRRT
jgi:hypothetical protein